MSDRIAGIDVHKKMLAVVVSDVEIESEHRMFGSSPDQSRTLAAWLLEQEVEEAVMESTAQYWRPSGKRWNGIGSRYARSEKGQGGGRERCIWHKRSPIAGREGARGISAMPNV
jgi:hypothetical protein